jgi:protein unc-119
LHCPRLLPTTGFLCPLTANTYGIEYLEFTILDYQTKNVIFNVGKDNPPPMDLDMDLASLDENSYRSIKYDFSEDVLRLPSIQTTLVFSVGNREMPNFRMVERHYFRDDLVKSYDFKFGFCIPSSTNTWDAVYAVPPLDDDLINDMINNPHLTRSDRSVLYMLIPLLVHHVTYVYMRCQQMQQL